MTIKLTIQQAEALYNLFSECIIPLQPVNLDERLIYLHMVKVFKKLRAKLEARVKGSGYSIALNDEEALAYYIYFNGRSLGEAYAYEQNFIQLHINEIDKKHA